MKTTTKMALAFAAFATLATSAGASEYKWRHGDNGSRHGMMERHGKMGGPRGMRGFMNPQERFERADTDKSGDVTYEEFAAVFGDRFKSADKDGDGELTVGEVADGIQRMMAERMAERMIGRLDANDDGKLTVAEIESQQKKIFAMGDRDDDGKITRKEMRRAGKFHMRRGWDDDGR